MRRLHALTALALAALAGRAQAAELSRVATSGEPGNPFDLDLAVRWDRTFEGATILREGTDERLRYTRTRNAIVPRVAVGLWNDLELHLELPYVLGDDRTWRYGMYHGAASGPGTGPGTIAGNAIDADGQPCAASPLSCALFQVKGEAYHGGRAGDLQVGLSWAVFNERKDDTKPTWVVGVDVTAPTAAKWEPGKNRTPDTWRSPYALHASEPGPFGEKIWKLELSTVLSRRYARFDPYLKAHARFAFKSASTYSNCDAVTEATSATVRQMNSAALVSCGAFGTSAGAKLPFVAGLLFGSELIPYEDVKEHQKVAIDLRLFGELTTRHRFYNELSDATGKLLMTEGYLEMGGLVGLYLRASQYVVLHATASLAMRTSHYLTGESLGKDGAWPALDPSGNGLTADRAAMNPNFDWRYDAPGRRFRATEVGLFELSVGGVVQF